MIKPKETLKFLSDSIADIFMESITNRYMGHPICTNFPCSENIFFAKFASHYYKETTSNNDYQLNISEEDQEKDDGNTKHPRKIVWKKYRKVMNRRNPTLVLLYSKANKHLCPEKIAYLALLLPYAFVNESDLSSKDRTYSGKLQTPIACATVTEDNEIFEPNSKLIDTLQSEISMQEQEKHFYED